MLGFVCVDDMRSCFACYSHVVCVCSLHFGFEKRVQPKRRRRRELGRCEKGSDESGSDLYECEIQLHK